MRERIFAGQIRIGSSVPSVRSLAVSLGVSVKVTAAAYTRLANDGWLRPVPRSGYIAVTPDMPLRRIKVLLVLPNESYCSDYVAHRFHKRCEAAGILVSRVVVADPEDVPVSLDLALMDSFDFIVSMHFKRRIVETIEASGVPFLVLTSDAAVRRRKNCIGALGMATGIADEVAAACASRGIANVELVDFHQVKRPYAAAFRRAGIAVKERIIKPERRTLWFEDIPRSTMLAFIERLSSPRPALPDLFFFLDDYVAKGALMAFALSGVRIPEDVKVITLANKGNGPIYDRDLARIELDPIATGDAVADFTISWLKGTKHAPQTLPPPVFIEGETI